jgi:hypothetical protein
MLNRCCYCAPVPLPRLRLICNIAQGNGPELTEERIIAMAVRNITGDTLPGRAWNHHVSLKRHGPGSQS